MTVKEARKILGKEEKKMTDEQVQEYINSASLLSDIFFDIWNKMTPEERAKWKKKSDAKKHKLV